ncbi:unnamed protein product [Sphagnum balticum]
MLADGALLAPVVIQMLIPGKILLQTELARSVLRPQLQAWSSISSYMLAAPCDLQLHLATGCLQIHILGNNLVWFLCRVRQSLSSCLVFGSPLGTMSFASD